MKTKYYFAYGSNMDPKRMKARGVNTFSTFPGKLNGWKLTFVEFPLFKKENGYADIIKSQNDTVEGVIYETDKTIDKLDKREAVPRDYTKEILDIKTPKGIISCLVFIGNPENLIPNALPTKEYLAHLLKGKPHLSQKYFNKLVNTKTRTHH